MSLIYQFPVPIPVTNGNYPQFKFAVFGDNLAAITASGYLNKSSIEAGIPLSNADVIMCLYSFNQQSQTGTFGIFTVNIAASTGVVTLTEWAATGNVILPTIANHIATYADTVGGLTEDPGTAISGGNIQAGFSGTAGTLASFPATAANGQLIIAGVAAGGAFNTTISNGTMAQSSTYTIPDAGNAVARFMVAAGATPFVSGNFPVASGTGGLMIDSGKSAASLPTVTTPTIANHIAVFTNTAGNLSEDAATAINGGNIQAGLSGTAGTLASFPSTAARGSLILTAVANTGNTTTTISNAAMGQASVISIPDPGAATADFALAPAALVNNNLVKASGTAGLIADAGIVAANVMQTTAVNTLSGAGQIILAKANGTEAANAVTASGNAGVITTSVLTTAGGASYAITWTNTLITATSVISLTIMGGTNTTENITLKATAGVGTSTLTIYNTSTATALNGTILIGYVVL